MKVWPPEIPIFKVLFGPLNPSFVAVLLLMVVIWDPGSIKALAIKVLVGVIILQINVLGKPRCFGMYCMVLRHWRPCFSPNCGLTSFMVLGEFFSHCCLDCVGGIPFDSSFGF